MKYDALFIGRFQPFHVGHLWALVGILNECKNVLIVIGSSEKFGTNENPYSYELRKQLITEALKANDINLKKVGIVPLPDINNDAEWVDYLVGAVPEFKTVYTGSENTKKLFEQDGRFAVKTVNFLEGINATMIRQKIKNGESVQEYLPYDQELVSESKR